eukprot:scaffold313907_cov22-Tisochrysis_lutea.AAC.1
MSAVFLLCALYPCSALGYAGTILVKSEEHVAQVEQSGPSNLLRRLGCPWLTQRRKGRKATWAMKIPPHINEEKEDT